MTRIAELETELRFIENNMRQLNALYDTGRMMHADVLAGAMEGWANRIRNLLAKDNQPMNDIERLAVTGDILRRLSALAEPMDDDTQWITALANDVETRGIVDDPDSDATSEACENALRIANEIRTLAEWSRRVLTGGKT